MSQLSLGLDFAKWLKSTGDEAVQSAAKTLWLSNSGGLALVIAYVVNASPNLYAAIALTAAAITFTVGICLGVAPQVRAAHNLVTFQVDAMSTVVAMTQGKATEQDLQTQIANMLPDGAKAVLVTHYLNRAFYALATGATLGALGLILSFL